MSNPTPKLTGITLAIAAALEAREEEERERKSLRIKAAKARNRRYGRHQGGHRHFGWRLEPALDGGAPVEVPDPVEQAAIIEIIELRKRGHSLMAVRNLMRGRGFRISHHIGTRRTCVTTKRHFAASGRPSSGARRSCAGWCCGRRLP